jgi:adenylyltransferase/sulfurtransferase
MFSAEEAYPEECCGLLLRSKKADLDFRHIRVRNAQDDLHADDPVKFPRSARNGYAMDSAQLLQVHKDLRKQREEIFDIYHSHPDQDAFFSAEDQRLALDDQGEPVYASTKYLVVSVRLGQAADWKLFHWDPESKEFKE